MHSVGQGNIDRINLRVCEKLLIGSVCLLDLVRFGSLLCVAHIARCNGLGDDIGMGFDGWINPAGLIMAVERIPNLTGSLLFGPSLTVGLDSSHCCREVVI
jgi:hypothetical protein